MTSIDFLSPTTPAAILALIVAAVVVVAIIRLLAGPPAEIARRPGLLVIRCLVILLILLLLANPVSVLESPGKIERAEVFYLLDTSQSMQRSVDQSRWDEVVGIIGQADEATRSRPANVKLFRFGHRLSSVEGLAQLGVGRVGGELVTQASLESGRPAPGASDIVTPTDADTRMLAALRQLTRRFGRSPPASVVLFSDGRARDAEGIEEMARLFAKLGVPIHVVPVGEMSRGGDVAVVAMIVPEAVRKHARVEIQVFLRSYGYEGRRAEVRLQAVNNQGLPNRQLCPPQPVLLRGGVQPVVLSFRADSDTRDLVVEVPALEGETDLSNNSAQAETYIESQKIRVLYVEGSPEVPKATRRGEGVVVRGPYSDLQDALTADLDIECVAVSSAFGGLRRVTAHNGELDATRGFPETSAELSAFDALILSSASRSLFTEEQIQWVERWISERGGGLCMVGGPGSFASGGWGGGEIEQMLPVLIGDAASDWNDNVEVQAKIDLAANPHPIWSIVEDVAKNKSIVESFPIFDGINRQLRVKSALAESLATATLAGEAGGQGWQSPMIAVGRYGKGRTMAMSTAITGAAARDFANQWGEGDNRYYSKFWRNVVYWLTENSTIGRRRLIAEVDKNYYRLGDKIQLRALAYDEGANPTQDYSIEVRIEPTSLELDEEAIYSPVLWPGGGMPREEGAEGPLTMWGELITLPKITAQTAGPLGASQFGYGLELQINDALTGGAARELLRIELTAMEDATQVDSTSIQIQILHDPFEQQNPFPNHQLLTNVAGISGGQVLHDSGELVEMLNDLPVKLGAPVLSKSPLWSNWWVWSLLIVLLTCDWFWRRNLGLA